MVTSRWGLDLALTLGEEYMKSGLDGASLDLVTSVETVFASEFLEAIKWFEYG